MAITASFDVDIANEFGIPAALLLNRIMFLSKYTPREDGFCWRTSEELKDELALGEYQIRDAIKKLTAAGVLEVKNTYIQGTMKKCRHFRITDKGLATVAHVAYPLLDSKPDSGKTNESVSGKTNESLYIDEYKTVIEDTTDSESSGEIDFETVWKTYPNKQGKQPALKAYEKAVRDGVSPAEILTGVERFAEWCRATGREKRYIPHGSSWFNQRRWEDELPEPSEFERGSRGILADAPSEGGEGWLNEVSPEQLMDYFGHTG